MSRFSHATNQEKPMHLRMPEIVVTYGNFVDVHPVEASKSTSCNFCKNNKEAIEFYTNHTVKNCPIIKNCRCSICGETGHTMHAFYIVGVKLGFLAGLRHLSPVEYKQDRIVRPDMGHCSKNPTKASITRLIGIFNNTTK